MNDLKEKIRLRKLCWETMFGQELVKLTIDPKAVSSDPDDVELLEDMIIAAVAQGMEKARELKNEEINKVTGGLGDSLSGMFF